MGKKKYYAVKHGKTPGVYDTWEACKSQVDGVSNAVYKSFPTKEEALCFAGLMDDGESDEGTNTDAPFAGQGEMVAYVDGSYQAATEEYSCGVVLFYEGEEIHMARKGNDEELAKMHNVAGEIWGAELAMNEAVQRGVGSLTIYHDYEGIAAWCLGRWKTNKEGTKRYKSYYDSVKDRVSISFVKVKGHSGDKWNDLADELARGALIP